MNIFNIVANIFSVFRRKKVSVFFILMSDPEPYQNAMDLQHCSKKWKTIIWQHWNNILISCRNIQCINSSFIISQLQSFWAHTGWYPVVGFRVLPSSLISVIRKYNDMYEPLRTSILCDVQLILLVLWHCQYK